MDATPIGDSRLGLCLAIDTSESIFHQAEADLKNLDALARAPPNNNLHIAWTCLCHYIKKKASYMFIPIHQLSSDNIDEQRLRHWHDAIAARKCLWVSCTVDGGIAGSLPNVTKQGDLRQPIGFSEINSFTSLSSQISTIFSIPRHHALHCSRPGTLFNCAAPLFWSHLLSSKHHTTSYVPQTFHQSLQRSKSFDIHSFMIFTPHAALVTLLSPPYDLLAAGSKASVEYNNIPKDHGCQRHH